MNDGLPVVTLLLPLLGICVLVAAVLGVVFFFIGRALDRARADALPRALSPG